MLSASRRFKVDAQRHSIIRSLARRVLNAVREPEWLISALVQVVGAVGWYSDWLGAV
jgi:hypothetical protein